jgi:hypothetical protein
MKGIMCLSQIIDGFTLISAFDNHCISQGRLPDRPEETQTPNDPENYYIISLSPRR